MFENRDVLDVERGARHHLAFGFGPHQCLGQNLARMELQIPLRHVVPPHAHAVPGRAGGGAAVQDRRHRLRRLRAPCHLVNRA
nr:cytochrome P450 [Nonomuraea longispora]